MDEELMSDHQMLLDTMDGLLPIINYYKHLVEDDPAYHHVELYLKHSIKMLKIIKIKQNHRRDEYELRRSIGTGASGQP